MTPLQELAEDLGVETHWTDHDGETQGAYIRYPGEEQWAVVCLAAAQHGAGIVGENQNFCRRAAYSLEDLDTLDQLKHTLDRLDASRKRA